MTVGGYFLLYAVVVLVSVQGVQNGGPHFQFTRFEGPPIFGLRAFKNF